MTKISRFPRPVLLAATTVALALGIAACNNNNPAPAPAPDNSAQTQPAQPDQSQPAQQQDPAAASNLAPASDTQATASNDQYSNDNYDDDDTGYGQPNVEASQPPPELPEYSQPDCPGDGYLWTPGYWGYSSQGYYWVPGAWTQPPEVGLLWTPGYWGFSGGRYRYRYGYWGRHIGYYGGINYGFGYVGAGYQGGYWNGNRFDYNRSVNNVTNVTSVQVYNRTVTNTVTINNTTVNVTNSRTSFNGPGGITRQPLPAEVAATREQRIPPMTTQLQVQKAAAQNKQQFASVNHGKPWPLENQSRRQDLRAPQHPLCVLLNPTALSPPRRLVMPRPWEGQVSRRQPSLENLLLDQDSPRPSPLPQNLKPGLRPSPLPQRPSIELNLRNPKIVRKR